MNGNVEKFTSKLEKINRLNEELVTCLINDPYSLDTSTYLRIKKQVYQQAIAYFENKKIRSQSNKPKTTNNRTAILFHIAIEDWRNSTGEKENQAAAKIAKMVLEASIDDLMFVPNDLRNAVFKIIKSYLTNIGGLHP